MLDTSHNVDCTFEVKSRATRDDVRTMLLLQCLFRLITETTPDAMTMKHVKCSGTPREIGLTHGKEVKVEVKRSLDFYERLFLETAALTWSEVCDVAMKFEPLLRENWDIFCEEMEGKPICYSNFLVRWMFS